MLVTISKPKRLLYFSFIGNVTAEEIQEAQVDLVELLKELSPGFKLLSDLERMTSIAVNAAPKIGEAMELCDQKGVELVVRVIPEQGKDIGLNILALFHYERRPRTVTCKTMMEAMVAQ